MKVFLPIKAFQSLYGSFSELLTPEGSALFQQRILSEADNIFTEKGLSEQERIDFIDSLKNPKTILFHSWVEQNNALFLLLTKGELQLFSDKASNLKHQYAEEFKAFISPFLSDALLNFSSSISFPDRLNALSFCALLDNRHKAVVESQLFTPLLQEVKEEVESCEIVVEEKELIDKITPICSAEMVECVNYLSRTSYALKMEYVDAVLSVLKYKSCTPRFANWVLKELRNVELNNEHENKITDLIRDLKKGDLEVRNQGKQKRIIKGSSVLTMLMILLLGGSVFWMVKYKPFNDNGDVKFSKETSFMQFSIEERKQIDSLLLVMNGNVKDDHLQIDQGTTLLGESDVLTVRKEFKNTVFENIHNDFVLDAESRYSFFDSCDTSLPFKEISQTKSLQSNSGRTKAMMKNESEYDVILILAHDLKEGSVYSAFIKRGETVSFEMGSNDVVLIVAGNSYQEYTKTKGVENLPSSEFKYHFCEVDDNYSRSISTVYRMKNKSLSKAKFLLKGNKDDYFLLIDLHSVLEEI